MTLLERLLAKASEVSGVKLSKPHLVNGTTMFCVACVNERNVPHVLICQDCATGYHLTGLVRRRSPQTQMRWLINGQASTGSVQVAHWGEGVHIVYATRDEVEAKWTALYEDRWQALLAKGAIFYPAFLFAVGEKVVCMTNKHAPLLASPAVGKIIEIGQYDDGYKKYTVLFSAGRQYSFRYNEIRLALPDEVEADLNDPDLDEKFGSLGDDAEV